MPEQYRTGGVPDPGRPPAIGAGGVIPLPGGSTTSTEDQPGLWDSVRSVGTVAGKASNWVANRDNWIRVAKVAVGAVLIVVGLAKLSAPAVAGAAAQVAPVGKIIKGVGK